MTLYEAEINGSLNDVMRYVAREASHPSSRLIKETTTSRKKTKWTKIATEKYDHDPERNSGASITTRYEHTFVLK